MQATPWESGKSGAIWGIAADAVFDGERFVDRPTVLVSGGAIVAVGEQIPESLREAHRVVELAGVTVLPGLVDCHQHLCFDGVGTLDEQVSRVDDEALAVRARASARTALLGGVTTLRDLGDRSFVTLGLRDDPELPTILAAGPPITQPLGHCWYLGGECAGPDELFAAVRERAERGCDVVKMMVTGGALTPTFPLWKAQFGEDDVRLVVDEAHRLGLPVAAHAHGVEGIRIAVDVGVDTIEHCTFMTEEMVSAAPPELLDDLAASPTAISATLGRLPGARYPPVWEEAGRRAREADGYVHRAGGAVVVGSDAGINVWKPHDVMPYAFDQLVGLGMTEAEALRAMTAGGADAVAASGKGRLIPGADADIVALDGDPRVDHEAVVRIAQVWRAGLSVDRTSGT
ncbi:MAG: amidohydrolase family protein [Acidimicrobiia bacterium]|nr:amidohydrolase family protein [Acidimicrobiia bacterium]